MFDIVHKMKVVLFALCCVSSLATILIANENAARHSQSRSLNHSSQRFSDETFPGTNIRRPTQLHPWEEAHTESKRKSGKFWDVKNQGSFCETNDIHRISEMAKCGICEWFHYGLVSSSLLETAVENLEVDRTLNMIGMMTCEPLKNQKFLPSISSDDLITSGTTWYDLCVQFRTDTARRYSARQLHALHAHTVEMLSRQWDVLGIYSSKTRCFDTPALEAVAQMCVNQGCCPREKYLGCPKENFQCSLCNLAVETYKEQREPLSADALQEFTTQLQTEMVVDAEKEAKLISDQADQIVARLESIEAAIEMSSGPLTEQLESLRAFIHSAMDSFSCARTRKTVNLILTQRGEEIVGEGNCYPPKFTGKAIKSWARFRKGKSCLDVYKEERKQKTGLSVCVSIMNPLVETLGVDDYLDSELGRVKTHSRKTAGAQLGALILDCCRAVVEGWASGDTGKLAVEAVEANLKQRQTSSVAAALLQFDEYKLQLRKAQERFNYKDMLEDPSFDSPTKATLESGDIGEVEFELVTSRLFLASRLEAAEAELIKWASAKVDRIWQQADLRHPRHIDVYPDLYKRVMEMIPKSLQNLAMQESPADSFLDKCLLYPPAPRWLGLAPDQKASMCYDEFDRLRVPKYPSPEDFICADAFPRLCDLKSVVGG